MCPCTCWNTDQQVTVFPVSVPNPLQHSVRAIHKWQLLRAEAALAAQSNCLSFALTRVDGRTDGRTDVAADTGRPLYHRMWAQISSDADFSKNQLHAVKSSFRSWQLLRYIIHFEDIVDKKACATNLKPHSQQADVCIKFSPFPGRCFTVSQWLSFLPGFWRKFRENFSPPPHKLHVQPISESLVRPPTDIR
jgi:hypothetical protein